MSKEIQDRRNEYNAFFMEYLRLNYPEDGSPTPRELEKQNEIESKKQKLNIYNRKYYDEHRSSLKPSKKRKHNVYQKKTKLIKGCIVIKRNVTLVGCPF